MKFHEIELGNVRGIERLHLKDIPDSGLIFIVGKNESGKSTIMDALGLLLDKPHSTSDKRRHSMVPVGTDEIPRVRLKGSLGGFTFDYEKRFAKRKGGGTNLELRSAAGAITTFRDRAAHDEMTRLLAAEDDAELREVLFLEQDDSAILRELGVTSLVEALKDKSGMDDAAAGEDSALLTRVKERYAKYWGASGNPVKAYSEATKRLDACQADVEARRRTVAEHRDAVQAFADDSRKLKEAEQKFPLAEQRLEAALESKEQAEKVAAGVAAAEAAWQQASKDLTAAREELQRRAQLREELQETEAEVKRLAAAGEGYEKAAHEESRRVEETSERVKVAAAQLDAHRVLVHYFHERDQRAAAADSLALIEGALADLARVDEELAEAAQVPEVTAEALADVQALDKQLAVAQEVQRLAAPTVRVHAPDPAHVTVDGEDVTVDAAGVERAVTEPTSVEIAGVTVTVCPPAGLGADVEQARGALREALAAIPADTVAHAEDMAAAAQEAQRRIAAARQERKGIIARTNIAESDLRSRRAQLQAELAEDLAIPDGAAETDPAAAQRAVQDSEAELRAAQAAQLALAERPAREQLSTWTVELAQVRKAEDAARRRLADLPESDADLDARVENGEHAVRERLEVLEEVRRQAREQDVELARSQWEAARTAVETQRKRIQDYKVSLAKHEATALANEEAADQLADAERALDAAQQRHADIALEAAALQRLYTLLNEAQAAARARYNRPFTDALERLAAQVFGPGTQLALNDGMAVAQRTTPEGTLEIESLSGGAKEQLGIITRLAIAELVSGHDEDAAVPVIFDDVLGNTDPDRLFRMAGVLQHAGERNQIIVLTSSPERFDGVRKDREYLMSEVKSEG